jgi:hypothetical protein
LLAHQAQRPAKPTGADPQAGERGDNDAEKNNDREDPRIGDGIAG